MALRNCQATTIGLSKPPVAVSQPDDLVAGNREPEDLEAEDLEAESLEPGDPVPEDRVLDDQAAESLAAGDLAVVPRRAAGRRRAVEQPGNRNRADLEAANDPCGVTGRP